VKEKGKESEREGYKDSGSEKMKCIRYENEKGEP
jgi:hypothetical protein